MWDERYSEEGFAYGTQPNDFLASVAPSLKLGDALCLAEGQGRNAVFLAGLGHRVHAVDSSRVGMARAEELARTRGVQIRTSVADLQEFVIAPSSLDTIVSIFAHVLPQLRQTLHQQVVAGLRPGGQFVLEAYTPEQLGLGTGGPKTPELTMTLEALRSELAGLDFDIGRELQREIHEGKYHNGPSQVVQVLATKRR